MSSPSFQSFMKAAREAAASPYTEVHRTIGSTVPAMVAMQVAASPAGSAAALATDELALGYVLGAAHAMFVCAGHGHFANGQLPTFVSIFETVFGDDGLTLLTRASRRVTVEGTRANLGARAAAIDVGQWDEHGTPWWRLRAALDIERRRPRAR